jgi:hypothetical protein
MSRSFWFLDAKACVNGVLDSIGEHGKSPCFSQVDFLQVVSPDYPLLNLPYLDGA